MQQFHMATRPSSVHSELSSHFLWLLWGCISANSATRPVALHRQHAMPLRDRPLSSSPFPVGLERGSREVGRLGDGHERDGGGDTIEAGSGGGGLTGLGRGTMVMAAAREGKEGGCCGHGRVTVGRWVAAGAGSRVSQTRVICIHRFC